MNFNNDLPNATEADELETPTEDPVTTPDDERPASLPVDSWLPPAVGGPLRAPYRGRGRPPRDSATLADIRSRFRGLVEAEGFDSLLNRKIGIALRDTFLAAWRAQLGVGDDVELIVRPAATFSSESGFTAGQLAWYGKVEELLTLLTDATAVPLAEHGRAAMSELHDKGYVGQVGRRAAAARRDPSHTVATLERERYVDQRNWVLCAMRAAGFTIDRSVAQRPKHGRTVGALLDDCVCCVTGDVDRLDVASRCLTLMAAYDREHGASRGGEQIRAERRGVTRGRPVNIA